MFFPPGAECRVKSAHKTWMEEDGAVMGCVPDAALFPALGCERSDVFLTALEGKNLPLICLQYALALRERERMRERERDALYSSARVEDMVPQGFWR
ncbi:hypothetical protein AMELA_G00267680 [Ameiurus melas]|uniref:Uncharacterized protein n=1 Tax=Ameiurus melas TaxID=219545 RepID=A0A7J5ZMB8_AMEME|nr:hypothetical protein AMELA_G00267680 [Ameiurus melas]